MPETTPGYAAALAAAEEQARQLARHEAEHGTKPLGDPVRNHPGLRAWNGDLLRIGHQPLTPFAVEVNLLLRNDLYVDQAHHEHVHLTALEPPPNYPRADHDWRGWIFCSATADGAVPITIAVTQTQEQPT
jgi:hypothetical protein